MLQPPRERAGTAVRQRKRVYRCGVGDVDFITCPRERDIEHPLLVGMVSLPLGKRLPGHHLVVPRQGVQDEIALVTLKSIGRDNDDIVLLPFLLSDMLRDKLLQETACSSKSAMTPIDAPL